MASGLGRQPKIEVLELTEHTIKFVLSQTHASFANSLRRVMIAEVPAFAIDLVQVELNETMLHDEFIAHRLGMIPLRYTGPEDIMRKFKFPRDCTQPSTEEEGCPHCSVTIDLSVHNKSADQPLNVTSANLVPHHAEVVPVHYSHEAERKLCEEADQGVIIVKLAPGERIRMRCIATLGTGKEHAKWCSCSTAAYHYDYDVVIDHEAMEAMGEAKCKEFVAATQPGVFVWDAERKQVLLQDKGRCRNWPEVLKLAAALSGDGAPVISVTEIPEKFIFHVESTGAHKPEDIVRYALATLKRKLGEVKLRCDQMALEFDEEEEKGAADGPSSRWVGAAAAVPYMLDMRDIRGGE